MVEDSLGLGETLVYLGPDDRAKDRLRFDPVQRRVIEGHLVRNHDRAMRFLEANRAQLIALAEALNAEGILRGDALAGLLSVVIPEHAGDGGEQATGQLSGPVPDQNAAAPLSPDTCPDSAPIPGTAPETGDSARSVPDTGRPAL